MTYTWLTTKEGDAWLQALQRCPSHDFYHLPSYHALAEQAGEGEARLFVYAKDDCTIALPLLIRPLDDSANGCDATSVYGYAGPVSSHAEVPNAVAEDFRATLWQQLHELHVVTVFSRLHPLFDQRPLLAGLGEFQMSQTVAIDLTLPPAEQRARYRRSFKEAINRLRRQGLTVEHDPKGIHLDEFVRIYYETMDRVEAAERYYFPPTYFTQLFADLGDRLNLFVCRKDGQALCGGLFIACNGMLQYHLGGTLNSALELAPMKLVMDEVRLWANTQGLRVFHLGGGTSADPNDPLLYFKRGFSDRLYEFPVWRWVLDTAAYERLCEMKTARDARHGLENASPNFFPLYRSPARARVVSALPPTWETPTPVAVASGS